MKILKGHHKDEQGILSIGTCNVDVDNQGQPRGEYGEPLTATIQKESYGEYEVISNGVWEFVADPGEFARCGIMAK